MHIKRLVRQFYKKMFKQFCVCVPSSASVPLVRVVLSSVRFALSCLPVSLFLTPFYVCYPILPFPMLLVPFMRFFCFCLCVFGPWRFNLLSFLSFGVPFAFVCACFGSFCVCCSFRPLSAIMTPFQPLPAPFWLLFGPFRPLFGQFWLLSACFGPFWALSGSFRFFLASFRLFCPLFGPPSCRPP